MFFYKQKMTPSFINCPVHTCKNDFQQNNIYFIQTHHTIWYQSCSTIFGNVLIVSSSSPHLLELLTTIYFLFILHSGIQNKHFDLLVTVMWLTKTPKSRNLFNSSEEDSMSEVMDPLGASFVTNATWWFWRTKNLWISPKLGFSTCGLILNSIRIL